MTKDEFMTQHEECKHRLCEKYGGFLYYLATEILNINHVEKICEEAGFTTERKHERVQDQVVGNVYSILKYNGQEIGHIYLRGFPLIELFNRKRKFSKKLQSHPDIIAPIEGVHGVLEWHTVRGKLHCFAGGQTVLHFIPINITNEMMDEFLTKTNLIDKVEEFKNKENKIMDEFKNKEL